MQRFLTAQEAAYPRALAEIKNGQKQSDWMWYIFPQVQGLGFSEQSKYYAIKDLREARLFLEHPVLGNRLIEISTTLYALEGRTAHQVFGSPDDLKLKSCMTLFCFLPDADPVFNAVLDKFFNGVKDHKTLHIISGSANR